MTEITPIKTQITGEKGGAAEFAQKSDDFLIFYSLLSDVITNVTDRNTPTPQYLTLTANNVFVQNIHAAMGSKTYSPAWSKSALVAKLTASAMASWVMLPCHSSMIVSQAIPLAT